MILDGVVAAAAGFDGDDVVDVVAGCELVEVGSSLSANETDRKDDLMFETS